METPKQISFISNENQKIFLLILIVFFGLHRIFLILSGLFESPRTLKILWILRIIFVLSGIENPKNPLFPPCTLDLGTQSRVNNSDAKNRVFLDGN